MKKTKKALASLAIAGMLATMVPFNALASVPEMGTRIAGYTAFETAQQISLQTESADSVVLAAGMTRNSVDALAAGPLAAQLKAPILLTDGDGTLTAEAKAELTRLMPKKVYVTSGTAVILPAALAEVEAITGVGTVVALGGYDAYETSLKIAKQMVALGAVPTGLVVAGGWASPADALSTASIAAAKGMPILAVAKTGLSDAQKAFVATLTAVTKSYVVGGTAVIDAAVDATLPGTVTRLAGNTQYDTNLKVLQNFTDVNYDKVFVANGRTFVDALAGAPLVAKYSAGIVLADGVVDPSLATYVRSRMSSASVAIALGGTAAVPQSVLDTINGITQGDLSVTSVSATSAESFKVVFSKAPADTSKVTFAVTQGTMAVTVSPTWNATKTEATISKASKFTAGTYSVKVMDGNTDLGSKDVVVTEQKVAKINITSTKLGVVNATATSPQMGYATYKILDQYGVDITNSALANNVQFQSGVGTTSTKNGLLTLEPSNGLNLLTFSGGIVITGNDTSTGVSTSATLIATSQIGTLSDITLTTLTNADGKVLTAGNTTDVFYAGYTALDISGNPTNSFTLMQKGLILTDNMLTTSSPYVKAELVQDPTDASKGLIKVTATIDSVTVDMPVVITAMTWTGKTSQISTTLKKQAAVDSFTLYSPSESIASGESKTIPFSALDQNGVAITKYSELVDLVTLTGAYFEPNLDGTASVKNNEVYNTGTNSIPAVISAVTTTGKYSSITINIQKPVKADTLSLDTKVLKSTLQAADGAVAGASQTADFGWDVGGFTVKDQYGRVIDMTTAVGTNYQVRAISSEPSVIAATGIATNGKTAITVKAMSVGSATVRFELIDKNVPSVVLDTKSQTFSVLKDADIKDYVIDTVANPIYITNVAGSEITDREAAFKARPKIYGTTSTGGKVVLRGTPVLGAISTSADFTVFTAGSSTFVGPAKYDNVRVVANKLADVAKTESSMNLVVSLMGADGMVHSLTTAIKGSVAKPAAASIDVVVATEVAGIERTDDTVTLTGNYAALLGNTLGKYDINGKNGTTQNVYFAPMDQYGTEAATIANFTIVPGGTNLNGHTFTLNGNGDITANTAQQGDYVTVSATTTTGLVKTIKIVFGEGSVVVPPVTSVTAAFTLVQNNVPLLNLDKYSAVFTVTDATITKLEFVDNSGTPSEPASVNVVAGTATLPEFYTDMTATSVTITAKNAAGTVVGSFVKVLPLS